MLKIIDIYGGPAEDARCRCQFSLLLPLLKDKDFVDVIDCKNAKPTGCSYRCIQVRCRSGWSNYHQVNFHHRRCTDDVRWHKIIDSRRSTVISIVDQLFIQDHDVRRCLRHAMANGIKDVIKDQSSDWLADQDAMPTSRQKINRR